jgi:copper chaperone CopZ
MSEKQRRVTFQVLDVDCASCIVDAKRILGKQTGVVNLHVNDMLSIFYIDYQPDQTSEEELERLMEKTGYKIVKLRSLRNDH